jgi:hypothetical protein
MPVVSLPEDPTFPVGTEIRVYSSDVWPDAGCRPWPPTGRDPEPPTNIDRLPVAAKVTMAHGGVTFGVPPGRYFCAGEAGGRWRIVHICSFNPRPMDL